MTLKLNSNVMHCETFRLCNKKWEIYCVGRKGQNGVGRYTGTLAQRLKTGMRCLQGLGCSIGQIGHFLLSTTEPIASEVLSPVLSVVNRCMGEIYIYVH